MNSPLGLFILLALIVGLIYFIADSDQPSDFEYQEDSGAGISEQEKLRKPRRQTQQQDGGNDFGQVDTEAKLDESNPGKGEALGEFETIKGIVMAKQPVMSAVGGSILVELDYYSEETDVRTTTKRRIAIDANGKFELKIPQGYEVNEMRFRPQFIVEGMKGQLVRLRRLYDDVDETPSGRRVYRFDVLPAVEGMVFDNRTGKGIAGATAGFLHPDMWEYEEFLCDSEGKFVALGLTECDSELAEFSRIECSVSNKGHLTRTLELRPEAETGVVKGLRVGLDRGYSIAGRVTRHISGGGAQDACAGIYVEFFTYKDDFGKDKSRRIAYQRRFKTDENGRFQCDGLPQTNRGYLSVVEEFYFGTKQIGPISTGPTSMDLQIKLDEQSSLHIKARDTQGRMLTTKQWRLLAGSETLGFKLTYFADGEYGYTLYGNPGNELDVIIHGSAWGYGATGYQKKFKVRMPLDPAAEAEMIVDLDEHRFDNPKKKPKIAVGDVVGWGIHYEFSFRGEFGNSMTPSRVALSPGASSDSGQLTANDMPLLVAFEPGITKIALRVPGYEPEWIEIRGKPGEVIPLTLDLKKAQH